MVWEDRGLAGPIGAEEAGDLTRLERQAQIGHGADRPEALGERVHADVRRFRSYQHSR